MWNKEKRGGKNCSRFSLDIWKNEVLLAQTEKTGRSEVCRKGLTQQF